MAGTVTEQRPPCGDRHMYRRCRKGNYWANPPGICDCKGAEIDHKSFVEQGASGGCRRSSPSADDVSKSLVSNKCAPYEFGNRKLKTNTSVHAKHAANA